MSATGYQYIGDPRAQAQNNLNQAVASLAEIPSCLTEVGNTIDELGSLISQLDGKLTGVLQPPVPATKANEGLHSAMQSPIGGTLQQHHIGLRTICQRVQDLLVRLQV